MEKRGKTLTSLAQDESQLSELSEANLGAFSGLITTTVGDVKIPGRSYVNGDGATMFMTTSGSSIGGKSDSFRFAYESTSGDVTMVVKVNTVDQRGKCIPLLLNLLSYALNLP